MMQDGSCQIADEFWREAEYRFGGWLNEHPARRGKEVRFRAVK